MKSGTPEHQPRPRRVRNTRGREKGEMWDLRVLLELRVANPTHVLEPGDEAAICVYCCYS